MPMLKYIWLTIKHKWFVFIAGRKLGVSFLRLLTHDMSKFSWHELPHYGEQFFGSANDPEGFIKCWVHHQNKNEHHWEYWIPRTGHSRCDPPYEDNVPLPMKKQAALEMIADWVGACKAYEGVWPKKNKWKWFNENFDKINIHPNTRHFIIKTLENYFIKDK